jgi:hypothetical protein
MFTSKEGVGLRTTRSVQTKANDLPFQQPRCLGHSAPAMASLSATFEQFFRNLPWNQGSAPQQQCIAAGAQTEPKTNTRFEGRFCQRGNSKCGDLAGVG